MSVCSLIPPVLCLRSGRRSLPSLLRLLRQFVLRPSLLDSHLQAGVAGGTGLHATPPEGEPRPGAVPALPLWRWTQLPDTARARRPSAAIGGGVFVIIAGGGGKVQVCGVLFLVPPLLPSHFTAVLVHEAIATVAVVCGGKDETSRVPEKLKADGRTEGKDRTSCLPMIALRGSERQRRTRARQTEGAANNQPVHTTNRPSVSMLISFLSGCIHTHWM